MTSISIPMTQQKYSDADLKFFSPKDKDDDCNYTITVKQLTGAIFSTKDVNIFCTSHKLWNDFLSSKQSKPSKF